MTLPDILLFFVAAFVGGAVNSVAGGGTFLVFPLLMINGLSSIVANIMCTIALWPGSVASAFAYRGELKVEKETLRPFIIISVVGSIIGTITLLMTPEVTFRALVPWLLLVATVVFTFGRHGIRVLHQFSPHVGPGRRLAGYALQFAIAIYGGYFGAGIGILMLAMLQVMGLTQIHQMNALKTILGSVINAVAVVIFILSGRVIWDLGIIMIAGAVLGGYCGARMALKASPDRIRWIVSIIGFAMTAYFFANS